MKYLGDILLEIPTSDAEIAAAVASAFGVRSVSVWPEAEVTDRSADIIVQRAHQDGDFPFRIQLTATPASGITERLPNREFVDRVRAMARAFDRWMLTDSAAVTYQGNFLLIAPGGETIEVEADGEALDENRVELTESSRALRAELSRSVHLVAD